MVLPSCFQPHDTAKHTAIADQSCPTWAGVRSGKSVRGTNAACVQVPVC